MASRIKSRRSGSQAKLAQPDYRYSVAVSSALIFLVWVIFEVTVGR